MKKWCSLFSFPPYKVMTRRKEGVLTTLTLTRLLDSFSGRDGQTGNWWLCSSVTTRYFAIYSVRDRVRFYDLCLACLLRGDVEICIQCSVCVRWSEM